MNNRISAEQGYDLLKAFNLLFSPKGGCTLEEIEHLDLPSLRNAFRRKALATHPDRARHLGQDRELLTEKFKEITDSFERLYSFVERNSASSRIEPPRNPVRRDRPRPSENRTTRQGTIPNQELMLGQYLYYTGRISYRMLLDAVYWQRNQRARYGTIARNWKIITSKDIMSILKLRRGKEKFGECAMRLGFIDNNQHNAIIKNQMCCQRPIGEYFVSKGIIASGELEVILQRLNIHNQMVRSRRHNFNHP